MIGDNILVCGMINNIRKQSNMAFIDLNDGTCLKDLQVILNKDELNNSNFTDILERGTKGTIISVFGKLTKSPAKGQDYELVAHNQGIAYFDCICDLNDYPISKNRIPLETLRNHLHLRMRTKAISSITRIRSKCSMFTHLFFQGQDFQYVHTPLITASDCEGAGETFTVTNLLPNEINKDTKIIDYSNDFFGKKTSLTVSGQLNVECYAMYFLKFTHLDQLLEQKIQILQDIYLNFG